jgi:hypothetical protein
LSHRYRPPFREEGARCIYPPPFLFLEEGARRRRASVALILPSSISGGGRASHQNKIDVSIPFSISGGGRPLRVPPPFLEEVARHVRGRGHASHRFPPPFREEGTVGRHTYIITIKQQAWQAEEEHTLLILLL